MSMKRAFRSMWPRTALRHFLYGVILWGAPWLMDPVAQAQDSSATDSTVLNSTGLNSTGLNSTAQNSTAQQTELQLVERVVGLVNERPIWLSQLRLRAFPFVRQMAQASSGYNTNMGQLESAYRRMLEQMVNEALIDQAAREEGISVTEPEVDRAIQNVRVQSGLDDPTFWNTVRAQGFTHTQYRQDVRKQLVRLKLFNLRVRSRINVSDSELQERYRTTYGNGDPVDCYLVSMVLVGSTDPTEVEPMTRALTVENFMDHGAVDLGRVCPKDLSPNLRRAVEASEVGQVSLPAQGPNGTYFFLLRERTPSASAPRFDDVRDQIQEELVAEAMSRQEGLFLKELRESALIELRL